MKQEGKEGRCVGGRKGKNVCVCVGGGGGGGGGGEGARGWDFPMMYYT